MTKCRGWNTTIVVLVVLLTLGPPRPAQAYLKFGFELNGQQVTLKWTQTPIQYFVSTRGADGVTAAALQSAVSRAFSSWQRVPTASIAFTFGGFTASLPGEDDGRSTLGFRNEPELDRVLASTSFMVDGVTGELLESDIFFNSAFQWSVSENGERNRWDVESIALHEIGHLSGLGHSAIGETEMVAGGRRVLSTGAVMFPIALGAGDVSTRQLTADDIAGISDLYPDAGFNDQTGSVSGLVTRNGRAVFGAHIVAFDPFTGDMVGNFTLDDRGRFSIAGLRPGPHVIRVEPLDDAAPDSFFDVSVPLDAGFAVTYYERLVVVPRGGDSGSIQIAVTPR